MIRESFASRSNSRAPEPDRNGVLHAEDMLQGLAFRCHTHCHAIHYLALMFLHRPCVMTHHDLLGGVSDVVHRFTDRAAVLHEQGRHE